MSNLEIHDGINVQKVKRKNSKSNRMKDLLIQELPSCFKQGEQKQPLCISIHLQVHMHYKDDIRFESKSLQAGLNRYCSGVKYLRTIVEGASRIDIHGHPVGVVTATEAVYAQGRLQHKVDCNTWKSSARKRNWKNPSKFEEKTPQPPKSMPKPISLEELRKRKKTNESSC